MHTHDIYRELSMGQESMLRAVKTFLLAPHPGRVLYAVVQKKKIALLEICAYSCDLPYRIFLETLNQP